MRYLITFFIFLSFTPIGCAQIFVNINATGNNSGTSWMDAYTDLRQAMTTATYGDEIWVTQGFYTPDPTNRHASFILTNGVRMYGGFVGNENQLSQRDFESNETILSGEIAQAGIMDNSYTVVLISNADSTTTIDGFTIRDGNAYTPDIWSLGDSSAVNGGGIYVEGRKKSRICIPKIKNCQLIHNHSEELGGSIYFREYYTGIYLENIRFAFNTAAVGHDVYYRTFTYKGHSTIILKNIVSETTVKDPFSFHIILANCSNIFLIIDNLSIKRSQLKGKFLIYIGSNQTKSISGIASINNLVVENCDHFNISLLSLHKDGISSFLSNSTFLNSEITLNLGWSNDTTQYVKNIKSTNCNFSLNTGRTRPVKVYNLSTKNGYINISGNVNLYNSIFDSNINFMGFSRVKNTVFNSSVFFRGVSKTRILDSEIYNSCFENVIFKNTLYPRPWGWPDLHLGIIFKNSTFHSENSLFAARAPIVQDSISLISIIFDQCLFKYDTIDPIRPFSSLEETKVKFNKCVFDNNYKFIANPLILHRNDTLENRAEYNFEDTLIGPIRFYSNSYEQLPCSRGVDVADSSFSTLDFYDKPRKFGPKVDAGAVETQSKTGSQITKVIPSCGNEGRVFFQQNDDHLTTTSWLNKLGDKVNPDSLVSGPYFMVWSDTLGCSDTVAFEIDEFPDFGIQSIIGSDIKCFGDNSGSLRPRIIGGLRPIIYNWSNGDTSGRLNNLSPGIYTLEIFDANGCYDIVDSIEIKSPDSIEVHNLSLNHPSVNQSDGSITLDISGGWPPLKFLWSNGDTSLNISGLQAGEYTLHVEDNRGCIRDFGPFILGKTATTSSNIHSCFLNPNPIFSTAQLFCDEAQNISSITIINTLGQASNLGFTRAKSSLSINLEEQSSGTYLLHIGFEKGTSSVVRIVVIK